jgi:membrane protein
MKTICKIVSQTVRQWLDDGAFQIAAALAFYVVISLAPLVTLSLSAASLFYGEEALRGRLVQQIEHIVGAPGAEVIQSILVSARQHNPGIVGAISVVMLLVGASALFLQLQKALDAVWNVAPRRDLSWHYTLKVRLLSMALVLGVGFLLLLSTVAGAVLEYFAGIVPTVATVWQSLSSLSGVVVATLLFAALFKVLPDAIIRWRDVWVGAAVTAILFEIGRIAIGFYLGKSTAASAYGAGGSLIALLLWIYYSALILLLGAEFAQVYARCIGNRIRPAAHAYRTSLASLPVDDEGRPILDSASRDRIKNRTEAKAS